MLQYRHKETRGFMKRSQKKQDGFTLLELIIVVVAIAILIILAISINN